MKARKKLIISFSILATVLLTVIVSMGVIMASFQATSNSGFSFTYTAAPNVNAWIHGYASHLTGADAANFENANFPDEDRFVYEVFDTSNTEESVTKTSEPKDIGEIAKDDVILVYYYIENRDTNNNLKITVTDTITQTNIVIGYATSQDATTWGSLESIIPDEGIVIETDIGFYIKINIGVKTQNATFSANYSFYMEPVAKT